MSASSKKQSILNEVDRMAEEASALARTIAQLAEPPFRERQSSQAIANFLEQHGFKVTFPFCNLPTAFRAEWGRGKPGIGILGEYDALPDCGAASGAWGHGCGHNLLGVGSAVGAIAAAAALARRKTQGKIIYYGCPAEETLAGKAYMARDGAFRDLDACIAWHPSTKTAADFYGGSAMDSTVYEFFGKTAHAAYPVGGKSALDAAILFDVAVNYLRESVPENVRIHAVILNGGDAPNVVPAYARSWYYIRGKDRAQVDEIAQRVADCARGAAIATQTRYTITRATAIYNQLPNEPLFQVIHENLRLFGAIRVTPADRSHAKKLGFKGDFDCRVKTAETGAPGRASSDESTVSWLAPLGRFTITTHAQGTPTHNRLYAAQMMLPLALRGMLQAGKVIAGATVDLLSTPRLLTRIRAEFRQRTRGIRFDPLIPKRHKVPVDMAAYR